MNNVYLLQILFRYSRERARQRLQILQMLPNWTTKGRKRLQPTAETFLSLEGSSQGADGGASAAGGSSFSCGIKAGLAFQIFQQVEFLIPEIRRKPEENRETIRDEFELP